MTMIEAEEAETPQRDKKDQLWVNDAELIRRLGVPAKIARETIRMLDAQNRGFPRKQKIWGNRRYWPDVVAYFNRNYGGNLAALNNRSARQ